MEGIIVCVVGGGVSGRSAWIMVDRLSARSEGRGGVCTSTEV